MGNDGFCLEPRPLVSHERKRSTVLLVKTALVKGWSVEQGDRDNCTINRPSTWSGSFILLVVAVGGWEGYGPDH